MRKKSDLGLLLALAAGGALFLNGITWGLPEGSHSWAVDALEPVTVLGIVKNSFSRWNSGWFYFKYPLAYPFTAAALYAPYLAFLYVTGRWTHPRSEYPYGFSNPESALFALALLGRLLNTAFSLATIAVIYAVAQRLFGRWSARLAAWFTATCYPVVYYAHTMNVDASYLFWLFASLWLAWIAGGSDKYGPWFLLGFCAAMSLATKEQAFGFLAPLPLLALREFLRAGGSWPKGLQRVGVSGIALVLTFGLANNGLYNPLGILARFAYLLGRPITPVEAPLKPVAFALFKGHLERTYLAQLWDGLTSALGTPLVAVALIGAAVFLRNFRIWSWLAIPSFAYYYLSLRGQQLITMRYALPAILCTLIFGSGLLGRWIQNARGRGGTVSLVAAALLGALSLARGCELDAVLENDTRYQAEAWLRSHLPAGARGEVYQKPTYLPRPQPGLAVVTVPPEDRTIEKFLERRPHFVVLSSASAKSISHRWNRDWRTTGQLLVQLPEAQQFVAALQAGRLPYRKVAVFQHKTRWIRLRITGLSPKITIYVRSDVPLRGT